MGVEPEEAAPQRVSAPPCAAQGAAAPRWALAPRDRASATRRPLSLCQGPHACLGGPAPACAASSLPSAPETSQWPLRLFSVPGRDMLPLGQVTGSLTGEGPGGGVLGWGGGDGIARRRRRGHLLGGRQGGASQV